MKVLIFNRKPVGYSDPAQELLLELGKNGYKVDMVNPDTSEGAARAELYEVLSFPSAILIDEDGRPLAIWRTNLPSIAEISTYLFV